MLAQSNLWVESHFDPATLRLKLHADISVLGDAANTTHAKTAAAARKHAPVVAHNLLAKSTLAWFLK
jgi:sulfide:quinone oxidoreductase